MRTVLVVKVVCVLLLVIAAFMLAPIAVALAEGETATIRAFLIPMGAIAALTGVYLLATRGVRGGLSSKAGFLLVTMSWLSAAAIGAVPFVLSGTIPRYTNAFFETMSGFTTTGATILTDIEALPASLLFWRSLTHWLGGMGIIVLTVAILPLLGVGGFQIMKAEAPGPSVDRLTPKITQTAKILWLIYLGLTVFETTLLMIGGLSLYDALTHTFGTLATGGFSPKAASVGHYASPFVQVVVTVFMIGAGVNFILYYRLLVGEFRLIGQNTEVKAYLGIFAVATIVIAIVLLRGSTYETFGESLRYAGFQAASILTTTGYATADFARWPALAQMVLFGLMFIGGSAGSTGGGIKVVRIVTVIKQGFNEMRYLIHSRGVFAIRLNGQPVRKDIVYSITGLAFLYLFMLLVTATVVASGGHDLLTSFTTALATLGNIGPGFGRIGPVEDYAFFQDYIKWYLSFIMMVGRLEIYTVLVLITPSFWRR
ncbi:MAG: TrkH family potassium uptake protein [Spirochaetota bacterium]